MDEALVAGADFLWSAIVSACSKQCGEGNGRAESSHGPDTAAKRRL